MVSFEQKGYSAKKQTGSNSFITAAHGVEFLHWNAAPL